MLLLRSCETGTGVSRLLCETLRRCARAFEWMPHTFSAEGFGRSVCARRGIGASNSACGARAMSGMAPGAWLPRAYDTGACASIGTLLRL